MTPEFEWDPAKRAANLAKHGIDFVDAARLFDGFVLRQPRLHPDYGEPRVIAIGQVSGALLTVIYTPRGSALRIISARRANGREARAYRAVQPPQAPEPDGLGPGGEAD
jgi:hypothetical protein